MRKLIRRTAALTLALVTLAAGSAAPLMASPLGVSATRTRQLGKAAFKGV